MMCVGQPTTGAPRVVVEQAQRSLVEHQLGYTATLGIPELRERIARWHRDTYSSNTTARNVVVTTGSSGAFVALFLAALDQGEAIAMARPGYPAYRNTVEALGARIVELPCGPSNRFQPTVAQLEALPEAPRALIVTSPNNPTGTIIDAEVLQGIARWCEAHGCLLISDEIYHGISYGRPCVTARNFSDEAVVVGSLSKFFSMTGWRLGWLIVPEYLLEPLENLQANLALCPPAISQYAALAAFDDAALAEVRGHVARYAASRSMLLERLPQLGFNHFAPPDGGFYLYVDVSHLTNDSEAWCREVLETTGVAFAPGVDFDPVDGHKYIRISFCLDTAQVAQACERIAEFLR